MLNQLLYESSSSDSDNISIASEISWSNETSASELEDVLYFFWMFKKEFPDQKWTITLQCFVSILMKRYFIARYNEISILL